MKYSFIFSLGGLLLLLAGSFAPAVAEQLTDGMGNTADFPDYRTDVFGNLHLVWHDANVDSGAIMYKMFDSAGNVLIDRTQVNTGETGFANTRPAMATDGLGLIYVVWQDMTDQEIYFMRLDPSLALLDGMPTTQGLIKVIGDVSVSAPAGDNAVRPRIRIDANADLHIVWESTSGGQVQYAKVNADGMILNGPVSLGIAGIGDNLPDIDVDTNGHAHIVFINVAPIMMEDEIYYAMIDGTTGLPLIDATLLSVDDGLRAGQATLSIDLFDNSVYVVFKQALMNATNAVEEIFLAKLNPSPPLVLKVSETKINGIGAFQWHVFSRIGSDRRIHASYMDFDEGSCPGVGNYTITDAHITFAGKVIARNNLTATGSATSCLPQVRSAPVRNRIVWTDSDSATGTREIFSATFARADAGESGLTCSLGNRNATGWEAGDLWLLLGAIAALGLWRKYRMQ